MIFYELYQDLNNPQVLTFIEGWESKEALKAHMHTEHFQRIVPQLNDLLIEKMDESEVNIYKQIK